MSLKFIKNHVIKKRTIVRQKKREKERTIKYDMKEKKKEQLNMI